MTGTLKNTCYHAIVNKKNQLLLQDCKLPIYWSKKVADKRVELFPDFEVIKIDAKKFNELLTQQLT